MNAPITPEVPVSAQTQAAESAKSRSNAAEIAAKKRKAAEAESAADAERPDDGYSVAADARVTIPVYNPLTKDYDMREMSNEEAHAYEVQTVRGALATKDPYALGPQFSEGDYAQFDYRWINGGNTDLSEVITQADMDNGFVPVRSVPEGSELTVFNETQFGECVRRGDLVLARRPKIVTKARAISEADLYQRRTGEAIEELQEVARQEGIELYGSVKTSTDDRNWKNEQPSSISRNDSIQQSIQTAMNASQPNKNGRRTFAINAPFQRDKVAERFGAVGG
nr:hypothetical protein [uncultured Rhodopila sp.]